MERFISRLMKPIVLAVIASFSVYFLTGSLFIGMISATIPLLLGWLGIMETFAYGMSAMVFIAAVFWAILPSDVKTYVEVRAASVTNDLRAEIERDAATVEKSVR